MTQSMNKQEFNLTSDSSSSSLHTNEPQPPRKNSIRIVILRMILMNFVFPAIIFNVATNYTTDVVALILSAIPPFLETIFVMITKKHVDLVSMLVLFSIAAGVIVTLCTNNPVLLLIKDSCLTAFFGTAFLISLLFPINLIWIYNRSFQNTKEDLARLDEEWLKPGVQRVTRICCLVWGLGLLSEAVIRILIILFAKIDFKVLANLSLAFPFVFTGLLAIWNYLYILYLKKKYPPKTTIGSEASSHV
ncbi:hypothetical protein HK099_008305 [Clydaea vesicula]|uniref:Uncharacterized protein n=1 Tax=Clydaea vesicula TaxID=447962 RepID=A0AAD5U829_9FUNG|nr:hypothetical protein HK099_008305 [Clydaea vesicula]KAJ3383200.1 hypothetical protein HDU92_004347 [Lobulomyces angularis]